MLLARITDIGEDQVVECCANAWMGVADLLWPEVKDIACPWRDVANNLKDFGSFIPGYRPGKRTSEYLEKVMMRITYVGAAFLAIIAVIPTLITSTMDVRQEVASFYGGTGLLIVVSVALDLVQKINSHLVMRNYPGLTED